MIQKKQNDQNTESLCLMDWNVNNYTGKQYDKSYLQKVSDRIRKNPNLLKKFIQIYNDDNNKGSIVEVDVSYPKCLQKVYSNLPFQLERMNIGKYHKLACNMFDKMNYVIHIKALKIALDYGLLLQKVHKVIEKHG